MLITSKSKYRKVGFDSEAEIEKVVLDNAQILFGSTAIILPKRKIETPGGTGTIPDAIVIDLDSSEWYIVEVERGVHRTWEHIAPQISKQLTAMSRGENKERVLRLALDHVSASEDFKEVLKELDIGEIDVHGKIAEVLKKLPQIAIPIDDIPSDLEEWANTLQTTVKIWIIKKFIREDGGEIVYSIPDDAIPDLDTSRRVTDVAETIYKGGKYFRRLLDAGLLHEDQQLHMNYGPRGQPKRRFSSTVSPGGLSIDGKVYSPSNAAVVCMRTAGSPRETANGWYWWRTEEGVSINDLYNRLESEQ